LRLAWQNLRRWQKHGIIGVAGYLSIFLLFLFGQFFSIKALTHPDVYLFTWVPHILGWPMTIMPRFFYAGAYESIPFGLYLVCMLLLGSFQWFLVGILWGALWGTFETFNPYRVRGSGSKK
jgi:hypothetical protein